MSERHLQKLEKEIFSKMHSIKNGKTTPKDSGIGKLFTILKKLDEVSYDNHLREYKKILSNIK